MKTSFDRNRIDEQHLEELLGLESSKIGFYAEVKQKIQELEAANLHLWVKQNELQAVFDAIGDGLLIFDAEGIVQYQNERCPELFSGENLLGRSCAELFHPGRRSAHSECPVEGALRGERGQLALSTGPAGRPRYLETTATPIEGPQGRPPRARVFVRDVTEKRLQELHLVQVEKMSSIGVLAAGVAHEINNPLASVGLYAEALLRRMEEPPLQGTPGLEVFGEYLGVIVREAHRCKDIIDTLLSFSRKSEGSVSTVALNELVREVVELVEHRARQEQVGIQQDLGEELPPVLGDPAGLRQVVLNLTINALQAVTVKGPGRVLLSTRREPERIVLRVSDTGCGIPPETLDQIWDPFYTTKPVGQGLGLGLSVTYNIVRKHGGEISVESEMGAGSTFTVRLPVEAAP
ncbi:MAG: PAS domain-containing protein [Deltaproteobacteria bacterium]|nr:PAS domain-containing protein [Deltaproteobacteria bacterium]